MKTARWCLLLVVISVLCVQAVPAEEVDAGANALVAEAQQALVTSRQARPPLPGSAEAAADDRLVAIRRELVAMGPAAVRVLLEEPQGRDRWRIRDWQLETIRRMGGDSIPALAAALRDERQAIRVNALRCLDSMDRPDAARAAVAELKDETAPIRGDLAEGPLYLPAGLAKDPRMVYLLTLSRARQAGEAEVASVAREDWPFELVVCWLLEDWQKKAMQAQAELQQAGEARAALIRQLDVVTDYNTMYFLVNELRDSNARVRSAARRALERQRGSLEVGRLMGELFDEAHGYPRAAALAVLAKTGVPEVHYSSVVAMLRDPDRDVRIAAARLIPRMKPEGVMVPVLDQLAQLRKEKSDESRRRAATLVRALGQLGDAGAVAPLTEILRDEDERASLRSTACQALVWLEAPALDMVLMELAADPEQSWAVSECRLDDLRVVMSDPVPFLITLLEHSTHPGSMMSTARALGRSGDERAIEPLMALAKKYRNAEGTRHQGVCGAAAAALGNLGDAESVPFLLELATSEEPNLRAVAALGEIGDARAREPLARLVRKAEPGSYTYHDLVAAFGKTGDPAAIPMLRQTLKSGFHGSGFPPQGAYHYHTAEAAEALARIGAPAVPVLLNALDSQYRHIADYAALALGQIGERRALEPLAGLLDWWSYRTRHHAAVALGELGDAAAIPHLEQATGDESGYVRVAAAEALWRLGEKAHLPVITRVLQDGYDDWEREEAAAALGRIGHHQAIAALREAERSPVFEVRWAAKKALAAAQPPPG